MPQDNLTPSYGKQRSGIRASRLRELGYKDYAEYLRSRHWARVRARYRASKRPQDCQLCHGINPVVLHHRTYEHLGAEPLGDLLPLCMPCHDLVHSLEAQQPDELDLGTLVDQARATRYAAAQEPLLVRAKGDFSERKAQLQYRKDRSSANRLKQIVRRADALGIDLSVEMAVVEVQLDAMWAKVKPG